MSTLSISCPNCRTRLNLPESFVPGSRVSCPNCRKEIAAPPREDTASPVAGDGSRYEQTDALSAAESSMLDAPRLQDELGRLGPYRILRKLGAGGMGIVFEAEDVLLHRRVALKVMLPEHAASATAKARFLREARSQAAVNHDNVAAIHVVGEDQAVPYIAMPLLKGQTLAAALKANPHPPLAEIVRIGIEMAEGLNAAHTLGLIHRDIKPANVWLEAKTRKVKILDFGLARAVAGADVDVDDSDGPRTQQGAIIGTPAYMSSEQAQGQDVDHHTDLWSLGVILYQMTTGAVPFRGATPLATLMSIASEPFIPPREKNPATPAALSDLIVRLLSKNKVDRPRNAQVVAEELERIGNEKTIILPQAAPVENDPWSEIAGSDGDVVQAPPRLASEVDSSRSDRAEAASSARWKWMAAAALVLGAGITAALLMSSPSQPPAPDSPPVVAKPPQPREKRPETPEASTEDLMPWFPDLDIGPGGLKLDAQGLPRLTMPFTPDEAKQAQEAWAKNLGRKVEETLDLGDGVSITLVLIPPGRFIMGGDGNPEHARHPVELTKPFYLGKHEVTEKQYLRVMETLPPGGDAMWERTAYEGVDRSNLPVSRMNWFEAMQFGEKVAARANWKGTGGLPTEAEWEYAYRSGTKGPYSFNTTRGMEFCNVSDAARDRLNPVKHSVKWDDGYPAKAPVGAFKPNAFGLYDMAGNVNEWVMDAFGSYRDLPQQDPVRLAKSDDEQRIQRGGTYHAALSSAAAHGRSRFAPTNRYGAFGFRLCLHLGELSSPDRK